jgi:hypothetical protein
MTRFTVQKGRVRSSKTTEGALYRQRRMARAQQSLASGAVDGTLIDIPTPVPPSVAPAFIPVLTAPLTPPDGTQEWSPPLPPMVVALHVRLANFGDSPQAA